ncbi:MAG TPA: glycosyltransferase family A protein [Chthoniobacterales bacterium]
MPLFSVIIPTYNRRDLLRQTLDSIMRQTCQDFEVFVIDDGSTDGTEALVAEFPGVTYLQQQHRGPGAARNLGWEHAKGEYLAFVDSDDLCFSWTLATYKKCIEDLQRPSFISGHPYPFYDEQALSGLQETDLVTQSFKDYFSSAGRSIWVGTASMVVRRTCRARFPEGMKVGEDLHLCLQLGEEPDFVKIENPHTIGYRYHGENAVTQFERTFTDLRKLVQAEKAGEFAGGSSRTSERRVLITRMVRQPALKAVELGKWPAALLLYADTFAWQVRDRRWKFLFGLPILAAWAQLRGLFQHFFHTTEDGRSPKPDSFHGLPVSAIDAKRHAEKAGTPVAEHTSAKHLP